MVIRRLMSALHTAGLVNATSGRLGGFQLARCPNEISLADVYRAVGQGDLFAWHPKPPNANCPVGANLHTALACKIEKANQSLEQELAQTSLSDLEDVIQGCECPN